MHHREGFSQVVLVDMIILATFFISTQLWRVMEIDVTVATGFWVSYMGRDSSRTFFTVYPRGGI